MQTAKQLDRYTLSQLQPVRGEGGRSVRALCPFHGSDRQRSLRVDEASGRFHCFACGAWGYLDGGKSRTWTPGPKTVYAPPKFEDRADLAAAYHANLWQAREYVEVVRGIPYDLAVRHGLGFAPAGRWAHRARDIRGGRFVVPHTTPTAEVVNLYGRAVHSETAKEYRHDHLPGPKGYFNAAALGSGSGPLYVCEGPFDALSLMAAGVERAVAIFGVRGWRWDWAREVRDLVLALDADAAGSAAWLELAREACRRGIRVSLIEDYGAGCKDANEAWIHGHLRARLVRS